MEELKWKKDRLLKIIAIAEDVIQRAQKALFELDEDYPSPKPFASFKRVTLDFQEVAVELRGGFGKYFKKWTKVIKEGQIKKGQKLKIIGKSSRDTQYCIAEDVLNIDGQEEVVINRKLNRYFITRLAINNCSWAKEVWVFHEN